MRERVHPRYLFEAILIVALRLTKLHINFIKLLYGQGYFIARVTKTFELALSGLS
jgi:hypothetical protein